MTVLVDSSALLALLDADDRFSESARNLWNNLLTSGEPAITTNYVIMETVALAQRRLGLRSVSVLYSDFVPLLTIHWVDQIQHAAALGAVIAAGRRELSFVDCASFEVMRKHGIQRAFTFDSDFSAAGFQQLA